MDIVFCVLSGFCKRWVVGFICEYDVLLGIGYVCGYNFIFEVGVGVVLGKWEIMMKIIILD